MEKSRRDYFIEKSIEERLALRALLEERHIQPVADTGSYRNVDEYDPVLAFHCRLVEKK